MTSSRTDRGRRCSYCTLHLASIGVRTTRKTRKRESGTVESSSGLSIGSRCTTHSENKRSRVGCQQRIEVNHICLPRQMPKASSFSAIHTACVSDGRLWAMVGRDGRKCSTRNVWGPGSRTGHLVAPPPFIIIQFFFLILPVISYYTL